MKNRRLLPVVFVCLLMQAACSKGGRPSEDPAIAAIKAAQDKVAQSLLRSAMISSKSYFLDSASYTGFGPAAGSAIEPAFRWTGKGPATVGGVSIDMADAGQLVLSTLSQSGRPFCMADGGSSGIISGSVDAVGASSAAGCIGSTW